MARLEALLGETASVRQAIRASGNPQAHGVEVFLDLSTRHVSAASVGSGLYQAARHPPVTGPLAVDGATIETTALVVVFASGKTSIDMCSTALLRWHGDVPTRPDREHDFADLKRKVKAGMVLSPPQQEWFDAVQDPDGKKLVGLRDAVIHRYVRQDVDVVIGGSHTVRIAPSSSSPSDAEDAAVLLPRLAGFAEDRWRQFWAALT